MSGFVRTPEEIEQIRARLMENRFFDVRRVSVEYLTDPAVVERVLPPGLEPADEPVARADVIEVDRSNCVGSFAGGGLYVRAEHDGDVGDYCLAMPMTTDAAIVWGRELFGEPKKQATVELTREGDRVGGRISRYGEPIVEIDATMEIERSVNAASGSVFHYKYLPDVTGEGFQFDPTLVRVTLDTEIHRFETGTGSLSLETTAHDSLGEIGVEEVIKATYTKTDIRSSQENLMTVDPEAFLPYAFGTGRVDDPLAHDNLTPSPLPE